MPNFVRFEKEAQLKQDAGFDISNFTEKEALEFAELMKREFLEHYQYRKVQNTDQKKLMLRGIGPEEVYGTFWQFFLTCNIRYSDWRFNMVSNKRWKIK